MKAAVFLSESNSVDITREELAREWEKLSLIPGCEYVILPYDHRLSPAELSATIPEDTEAVFGLRISSRSIDENLLTTHPKLKYIAGLAHGYGDCDFAMTRRYGVTITNTAYGDRTIAEYAFALLLAGCRRVETHSAHVKSTDWQADSHPRYMHNLTPQIELYRKTFGIIGLGKIGVCSARIANGFGMRVLGYSRTKKTGPEYEGIEQTDLDTLLSLSDVISVHAPFNEDSRGMISRAAIAKMKDGVMFINTARGGLVDEEALADALDSGKVSFAGLDVLVDEPPKPHNRLVEHPNTVVTSHIAWLPKTSRMRQVSLAIDNWKSYLAGNPVSVINGMTAAANV